MKKILLPNEFSLYVDNGICHIYSGDSFIGDIMYIGIYGVMIKEIHINWETLFSTE